MFEKILHGLLGFVIGFPLAIPAFLWPIIFPERWMRYIFEVNRVAHAAVSVVGSLVVYFIFWMILVFILKKIQHKTEPVELGLRLRQFTYFYIISASMCLIVASLLFRAAIHGAFIGFF